MPNIIFTNPNGCKFLSKQDEPLPTGINMCVGRVYQTNSKIGMSTINMGAGSVCVVESEISTETTSSAASMQFKSDEVVMILEMLQEWRKSKDDMGDLKVKPSVHERVKSIPQKEKARKTMVIEKAIGERLDSFCEKERFNKSDIMYLALEEFLDTHS